jgi:hypothetical protein
MRLLFSVVFLFMSFVSHAQQQSSPGSFKARARSIQLVGGYTKHGSGDMKGIVFGMEYLKYVKQRTSLCFSMRGTINGDKTTILFTDPFINKVQDASVRSTTAGVQLAVVPGIDLVQKQKHRIRFSLGPLARYQSASNGSDGFSIITPNVTAYPRVLIEYDNRSPQHTYAFGGIAQVQYDLMISSKMHAGLFAAFQTDTNGDAIVHMGVAVGRSFVKFL